MLDEHRAKYVRFSVRTRGCTGQQYTMSFVDAPEPTDERVLGSELPVLADARAMMFLIGTHVDFVSEPTRSEFVFSNPKIRGTCGCGESFRFA